MEDGYNMMRTVAPKDFGGRLLRNCALTTPELPVLSHQHRACVALSSDLCICVSYRVDE